MFCSLCTNPTFLSSLLKRAAAWSSSTGVTILLRFTASYLTDPSTSFWSHHSFNAKLSSFITTISLSQGLSKDDVSLLLNPQPCTPSFYFLLKIHKPSNPDCSIVASTPLPNVSQCTRTPTHIVKSLSLLIKATNNFFDIIKSPHIPFPPNTT